MFLRHFVPQTRVVLLNWCAWFLRMRRPGEHGIRSACHNKPQHRSSVSSVELCVSQGALQSTNPNTFYIGFRGTEGAQYNSPAESALLCRHFLGGNGEDVSLPEVTVSQLGLGVRGGDTISNVEGSSGSDLGKILEEVRFIARRFQSKDEDARLCNEWKFAAAVIDRICLMAFLFFTILCTFGILMSAPNFVEAVSKDFFS